MILSKSTQQARNNKKTKKAYSKREIKVRTKTRREI